jgi:hypothetical protein
MSGGENRGRSLLPCKRFSARLANSYRFHCPKLFSRWPGYGNQSVRPRSVSVAGLALRDNFSLNCNSISILVKQDVNETCRESETASVSVRNSNDSFYVLV